MLKRLRRLFAFLLILFSTSAVLSACDDLSPTAETPTFSLASVAFTYEEASLEEPVPEETENLSYDELDDEPAYEPEPVIRQADEIDPSKPMIAFTFDDGPSRYTPLILDLLEYYNVRATFGVVGDRVGSRQETVTRAAELGNEIISHSWSHRRLTRLSANQIKNDLLETSRVIEEAVGVAPLIFRPPYGAINNNVMNVSRELELAILLWSIDTKDWKYRDADVIYNIVMEHAADGAIVLSHDLYEVTVEAMERIIPELISEGFQLVTISELLGSFEAGEIIRSRDGGNQ
ncbi:MAG: polysaccharide deacetylase family protein [Defluviitaleaceae bacterium]|nr:polysaccharide deacetylase family protein [Defluviitaleaceae bacterium]